MQQVQNAYQMMEMCPVKEMQAFLVKLIEASPSGSELEKKKLKTAWQQLQMLALAEAYIESVRGIIE
jgi:hypothetical protein